MFVNQDVGEAVAKGIIEFFKQGNIIRSIEELLRFGVKIIKEKWIWRHAINIYKEVKKDYYKNSLILYES